MSKVKKEASFPEINWLRAAIIDRKNSLHLSWDEIGEAVGTTGDSLKHLMYNKPNPWDWSSYTRSKVCRVLGIEVRQFVIGSPEDPNRGIT